jgi:diguanylate cyclase (GGDEF)-like protein
VAPTQSGVFVLALFMFAAAGMGLRRAHATARNELNDEQTARAEAERRSRTDALTGLFNRRHAVEEITHELARSGRDGVGVGLLMFDIDYFKRVNDGHGHTGGDAVIVEVARRLQAGVREWDTVARIGGEEYFIIAPGMISEAQVAELGDRIRQAVADRPIAVPRGGAVSVTISVGAVLVRNTDGSAEYAIDRADRALYAAKRRGRNQLCQFSQLDHLDARAEQPECLHVAEAVALTSAMRHGGSLNRSRLVAELSGAIARRLALTEEQILRATMGGWLCDMGMIMIPDAILAKTSPLTDDERAIIRAHPQAGEDLLHRFPELIPACPAVRHHHERYDGAGYPDHLAGILIPIEARIVAVADAYSAMTSERPYRATRTSSQAVNELNRCAGTQFDPQVVAAIAAEFNETSAAPAEAIPAR